ncbi:MAG: N-6 DNA methylase [Thermoproteota archaeon]|jgi:adenine-specific DNA-methyltransferase
MEKSLKSKEKALGQYFTPRFVAEFMASLITKPKNALILEPSAGTGIFLSILYEKGFRNIHAYEIDKNLPNYSPVRITYQDFLSVKPEEKYDVIIGNPPYVRWKNIPMEWRRRFLENHYWKNIMNGLSDLTYAFIYHSVNALKEDGELIFITPIFWTETVHGSKLRRHLIERGHLELLVNFNEMRIFKEVSSTIIIFKYVKARSDSPVKVINIHSKEPLAPRHLEKVKELINRLERGEGYIKEGIYEAFIHDQPRGEEPWRFVPKLLLKRNPLLTIEPSPLFNNRFTPLGVIAEIGNGMVSGLDKAFQLNKRELAELTQEERKHVIYVYKANTLTRFFPKDEPIPYIYMNDVEVKGEDELRNNYPHFYEKLAPYKEQLLRRYNYGRDIPWWHWVFTRNKHLFEEHEEKIFVPSKERYDTKGYFRFAYVKGLYYATQDVTVICSKPIFKEGAFYLLALLNSEPYQEYIIHRGFTRGGVYDFSERPLATIPILRIDWNSYEERKIYEEIVEITKTIITNKVLRGAIIDELNNLIEKLLIKVLY